MHYVITGWDAFIGSYPVKIAPNLIDFMFGVILIGCLCTLLYLFCRCLFLSRTHARGLSNLNVAKLLERDVVPLEASEAHGILKGQIVLVTGAAGSIGSELCCQLLNYGPARIIALDNNETGLFDLIEGLRLHKHSASLCPYICDIRDLQGMERLFANEQPQIVFHAAAYKHVPLLERHPGQALHNNAIATFHLCRLAQLYKVDRFVFVSTDKASNPVSILGATKRLGEIVVQAMAKSANCTTRFCAVRFGNVIGSRGSVVPVFARQIEQGGPVTVTHPAATRYFMTIPEACGLVILTVALADQGGLYLLDMGKPVRIVDLAIKMIRLRGLREGRDVPIVYTGLRVGERLHETLVAVGEELVPTRNSKIFSVKHSDGVPMLSQVTQWMLSLNAALQSENSERLRERLFGLVRVPELLTTNNGVKQEREHHNMNSTTSKPKLSIIIPSWTGEVSRPMQSIKQQTFRDYEIEVVQRASPLAHARNLGTQRTRGDILLFIDDDITLGHEQVLQKMVDLLESDAQIAVVGISIQVPVDASRFQRAVAWQVPRYAGTVISSDQISNPPLDHYGFTAICGGCCAVRRSVYEELGGFDEEMLNCDDNDFFYRVHCCGYNLALAADCWMYHEPPTNLKVLLRKSFWYGIGHVLESRKSPERGMDVLPLHRWYGPLGLLAAIVSLPLAFFVHYYFDTQRFVFGLRPLKTLSTYATLCGYVYGWYHGKPRKTVALLRSGRAENV